MTEEDRKLERTIPTKFGNTRYDAFTLSLDGGEIYLSTPWGWSYDLGTFPPDEVSRKMDEYEGKLKTGYRPVITPDGVHFVLPGELDLIKRLQTLSEELNSQSVPHFVDNDIAEGMRDEAKNILRYLSENFPELSEFIEKLRR